MSRGYAVNDLVLSYRQYVDFLVHIYGHTREEAVSIASKEYVKQYGKTPEEHNKENSDSGNFFEIDPKANPFTPEQQDQIEKFLDDNKELMDDLAKNGD